MIKEYLQTYDGFQIEEDEIHKKRRISIYSEGVVTHHNLKSNDSSKDFNH